MTSKSSEEGSPGRSFRPGAAVLAAALTGALGLAAACAGGGSPGAPRVLEPRAVGNVEENLVTMRQVYEQVRYHGEFGLMVRDSADQLSVHWVTQQTEPGVVDVYARDSLLHHAETPVHLAHGVSLPRPDAQRVRLVYGSLENEDDRHTTVVELARDDAKRPRYTGVDSIFAVGDVHGEYRNLTDLLYNAGIVDEDLRWYGGRAHVVFTGDLFDRGDNVTKVLWYIYGLERQARRAGGRVHVLLGNHETMVLTGDLRYVAATERMLGDFFGLGYPEIFDVRHTVLGRWLASRQGLVEIDDHLFVHGGVTPEYARYEIGEFNDSLSKFMNEELFSRWGDSDYVPEVDSAAYARRYHFFFSDRSPFWYRGYVTMEAPDSVLSGVLERYDAHTMVVGHTIVDGIQSLYDGTLIGVDLDDPASEILFLRRKGEAYERLVFGLRGPERPLPEGPATADGGLRPDG